MGGCGGGVELLHGDYILTMSARVRSKRWWPIIMPAAFSPSRSSGVIFRGWMDSWAYVPGPLRLERGPGLTTRTLSTTCSSSLAIELEVCKVLGTCFCERRQCAWRDQHIRCHIQPFPELEIAHIQWHANGDSIFGPGLRKCCSIGWWE